MCKLSTSATMHDIFQFMPRKGLHWLSVSEGLIQQTHSLWASSEDSMAVEGYMEHSCSLYDFKAKSEKRVGVL